jgi:modification methylase
MSDFMNRLIVGDAKNVLASMPEGSVDLVITSPPYWTAVEYDEGSIESSGDYGDYIAALLEVWKGCLRVLRPNGKLAINTPIMPVPKKIIGDQHTRHLKNINNDIEHSNVIKLLKVWPIRLAKADIEDDVRELPLPWQYHRKQHH